MNTTRVIAVIGGACLIALGALTIWPGDAPEAPADVTKETTMAETPDRSEEARRNYSAAPEPVQELAVALFNGTALPPSALGAATPDMLSALYTAPDGSRRNVLLDAFGFDQVDSGTQLVAAGADVNVGNHLLARGAIARFDGSRLVPFPDFSGGMPWLRLYVDNGGDVNAQMPDEPRRLIHRAAGLGNLEALLYLLDQGADGWLTVVESDGFAHAPFFENLASRAAGITAGEILFRIAHAGHLQSGTVDQVAPVLATIEELLADGVDATGPRAQRVNWQLATIARTIIDNSEGVPSAALSQMLATPASPDETGWHLGPDMVRSPAGTPEEELDFGNVVWAE